MMIRTLTFVFDNLLNYEYLFNYKIIKFIKFMNIYSIIKIY